MKRRMWAGNLSATGPKSGSEGFMQGSNLFAFPTPNAPLFVHQLVRHLLEQ